MENEIIANNKKSGSVVVSVSISPEFWEMAKNNHISWSEAMRVGLSVIFGDLGIIEYNNNINLYRRMIAYQRLAEESEQKYHELMGLIAEREGMKIESKKSDENK
jgi:hypothetical protein